MRKLLFCACILILSSCATNKTRTTPVTLNDAARQFSVELDAVNINGTFAVIHIASQSQELNLQIVRLLENTLVKNADLTLVTRRQIETVLDEQNFGVSGYVDDNSAQRIGHILGAKYILIGELTRPGKKYFLNIQVLETESARLVYSNTFEIDKKELLNYEKDSAPKPNMQKPGVTRF
jgi:curli biogenesis system outer membrane secretion channel CsgG